MVFNGGSRAILMTIVAIATGVLPPLIKWFRLVPKVSYRESLEKDGVLLYLLAMDCPIEDCQSQVLDQQIFFQNPRLLARSFQATRVLGNGKVRANYASGVLTTSTTQQRGTFIGVSTVEEAEETLRMVQKDLKKEKQFAVDLELVPIDLGRPGIQSLGYLEGDFAQWLLTFKLKRAAKQLAVEQGVQINVDTPLQIHYSNVIPQRKGRQVEWGMMFDLEEISDEALDDDSVEDCSAASGEEGQCPADNTAKPKYTSWSGTSLSYYKRLLNKRRKKRRKSASVHARLVKKRKNKKAKNRRKKIR